MFSFVLWLAQAVLIVPIGKAVPVEITPRQRVSEMTISDDRVVDTFGNNVNYLRGKASGVAWVTITGIRGGTRSALVVVPK